jgi:hypothetical protein
VSFVGAERLYITSHLEQLVCDLLVGGGAATGKVSWMVFEMLV